MNRDRRLSPALLPTAALAAALAGVLAAAPAAHAFAEDTCAPYTSTAQDAINYRFGNCGTTMLEEGASLSGHKYGSSNEHLSAVYVLAREAGFTDAEARTLVYYEESVDLGRYKSAAISRQPLGSWDRGVTAALTNAVSEGQTGTASSGGDPGETGMGAGNGNIDGVVRTSVSYGGAWLHYVPWLGYASGPVPPNTLAASEYTVDYASDPDGSPFPSEEVAINQARAWAFGRAPDLCRWGLTAAVQGKLKSGATLSAADLKLDGQSCAGDDLVHITIPDPTASGFSTQVSEGDYLTGWQPIVRDNPSASCDTLGLAGGACDPATSLCPTDEEGMLRCFDEGWNRTWNTSTRIKRLGIYLHLMQDRVSHEACTAIAPLYWDAGDGLFHVDWYEAGVSPNSAQPCGNQQHVDDHLEEIGQGQCTPSRTRTALELTLRELVDWLRQSGRTPRSIDVTAVVDRVYGAIIDNAAADRLAGMCAMLKSDLGSGFGSWYDGNTRCVFPTDAGDVLPSTCQ